MLNSLLNAGAREIGYLFGQYKRLKNEFTGSLHTEADAVAHVIVSAFLVLTCCFPFF